ncbi:Lrp/AsnC family transcriptional regulator [Thalassotalea ganghwensis]
MANLTPYNYDDVDRELIALLREDARASVSALAKKMKVSRATVQKRIDRLVSTGAILGFTIRAHQHIEANTVKAIMMIEVTGQSTRQVIHKMRGIPELKTLHSTNGKWDLVAELETNTLADFDRVLRLVREIDHVRNSETSILLSTV